MNYAHSNYLEESWYGEVLVRMLLRYWVAFRTIDPTCVGIIRRGDVIMSHDTELALILPMGRYPIRSRMSNQSVHYNGLLLVLYLFC